MGSAESQLLSNNIHQVRSRGLDVGIIVEDGVDLKKSERLGLEKELCNDYLITWQDVNGEEYMPSSSRRKQSVEPQGVVSLFF